MKQKLIAVLLPSPAFKSCLQATEALEFSSRKKVQEKYIIKYKYFSENSKYSLQWGLG